MKVLVVTGQTATGKTTLALKLASKYNGELVNFDSRQIYKYLDVITGKDIKKNQIHLYDVVDPKQYFSSFDYQQLALSTIRKIVKKGKTPILVGGTYFYIKHLLYGVQTENIKPDWNLRKGLSKKSVSDLQKIYKDLDLKSFEKLNNSERHNRQRLIRRIEIFKSRLSKDTHFEKNRVLEKKLGFDNLKIEIIGLRFKNKKDLRMAIDKRIVDRLKHGAIEEVKSLLKRGYKATDPGLKTIGYQQLIKYLTGKLSREEAINEWSNKEVQYAKRQYTFMKKDKNIKWRDV